MILMMGINYIDLIGLERKKPLSCAFKPSICGVLLSALTFVFFSVFCCELSAPQPSFWKQESGCRSTGQVLSFDYANLDVRCSSLFSSIPRVCKLIQTLVLARKMILEALLQIHNFITFLALLFVVLAGNVEISKSMLV